MARYYSEKRAARRGKLNGRDYRWKFWPFILEIKDRLNSGDSPAESPILVPRKSGI